MGKLLGRALKLGGLLFLVAIVGFCGFLNLVNAPSKGERDQQARADANQLIEALGAYYSDQDAYPPALDELTPRYLSRIPEPQVGGAFEYVPATGGRDFRLGYPEAPMGALPSDGFYSYEASSGQWRFAVR